MKNSIIILVILFSFLSIGYYFKEEYVCLNIYANYYVASYFTISVYIVYIIIFFKLSKFIYSMIKGKI